MVMWVVVPQREGFQNKHVTLEINLRKCFNCFENSQFK